MKPEMNKLVLKKANGDEVDVLQDLGGDYQTFGTIILEDKRGAIMEDINDNHSRANDRKREIMRRFINGKGMKPVTWRTVVTVLNEMRLTELVSDIEEALK